MTQQPTTAKRLRTSLRNFASSHVDDYDGHDDYDFDYSQLEAQHPRAESHQLRSLAIESQGPLPCQRLGGILRSIYVNYFNKYYDYFQQLLLYDAVEMEGSNKEATQNRLDHPDVHDP